MTMRRILVAILMIFSVINTPMMATESMHGSGATFPAILVNKMVERYTRETGKMVTYAPVGSFVGLSDLINGRSDFAVSDVQLQDADQPSSDEYIDLPVALGAVALVYNIPGVPVLKLTPDVILGILSGTLTRWNDPEIQEINSTTKLPDLSIKVIIRSDRSGTTFLLNQYLSDVDSKWAPESKWTLAAPNAIKAYGNQALVNLITQTPGSFGYTEAHYASVAKCAVAALQNGMTHFILPNTESVLAAIEDVPVTQIRSAGINSFNEFAYPIVGFSWVSTARDQSNRVSYAKAQSIVDLIWWMTHQGQVYAESNGFTPLPPNAMKFVSQQLKEVRFDHIILR